MNRGREPNTVSVLVEIGGRGDGVCVDVTVLVSEVEELPGVAQKRGGVRGVTTLLGGEGGSEREGAWEEMLV